MSLRHAGGDRPEPRGIGHLPSCLLLDYHQYGGGVAGRRIVHLVVFFLHGLCNPPTIRCLIHSGSLVESETFSTSRRSNSAMKREILNLLIAVSALLVATAALVIALSHSEQLADLQSLISRISL